MLSALKASLLFEATKYIFWKEQSKYRNLNRVFRGILDSDVPPYVAVWMAVNVTEQAFVLADLDTLETSARCPVIKVDGDRSVANDVTV